MAIKRMLGVFSGDQGDRAVRIAALALARRFQADVDIIHARDASIDLAQLTGWGFEGPAYVSAAEAIQSRAGAREESARSTFAEFAVEFAAPSATAQRIEMIVDDGREADLVIRRGAAYDLIIIRRSESQVFDTVEAALFQTGRPVLLVPPEAPVEFGRRVLLAWNHSAPAARAIAAALPLIQEAADVTLFHVATGAKRGTPPELMLRYLEAHGVDAALTQIEPAKTSIAEAIMETAKAGQFDLIVLGAYSHSRFRERILGGVTSQMLAQSELPVLMSH
jgi:nucleotide-binding universal stress UspA family protein